MSNLKVNNIEPYSNQNVTISGSLTISGSGDPIILGSGSNPLNITSSYAITASYALNGGGGGGGSDFPYTGSAIISGGLEVTGSLNVIGSAQLNNFYVTISSSIVVATQSLAPGYTGTEGEIVPVEDSGTYYLYTYIGGAWRSASLA